MAASYKTCWKKLWELVFPSRFFFIHFSSLNVADNTASHLCTWTISHPSDMDVTELIKPISYGGHMAWVQHKLVQGTLLKRKTTLLIPLLSTPEPFTLVLTLLCCKISSCNRNYVHQIKQEPAFIHPTIKHPDRVWNKALWYNDNMDTLTCVRTHTSFPQHAFFWEIYSACGSERSSC